MSNYAARGHQCAHNLVYWRNQRYHAFGMAAAGYVGHVRFTRPKTIASYLRWCGTHHFRHALSSLSSITPH